MTAVDGDYAPIGGRTGQAVALSLLPWHVALGAGDPDWDAVDRASPTWQSSLTPDAAQATALVAEIGRRVADEVAFVAPDPGGDINLPDSRWSRSAQPTAHLYVMAQLDYADAAGMTIRESGLFANGASVDGVPAGQRWFASAEIADTGNLMRLRRYAVPMVRSANVRLKLHWVISF